MRIRAILLFLVIGIIIVMRTFRGDRAGRKKKQ
jgi:hypothetical protein